MVGNDRIFCFEPFDVSDPLMRAAEQLYEATQHPDERIPWGWIARSVKGRVNWRPGQPGRHLLLAMPEEQTDDPSALAGFAYGTHLPGYGGYISYIGVSTLYRKRGVGTRLFEQMFKLLAADAGAADEKLPFVVWESHQPDADSSEADWCLWVARTRLFDRVGGQWINGLELYTPNYSEVSDMPVKLQLFVKPMETSEPLNPTAIATGLLERVYRMTPDDPLYQATMGTAAKPQRAPRVTTRGSEAKFRAASGNSR